MEVEVSVSWLGEARIRLVASCPGVMSANMSLMYTSKYNQTNLESSLSTGLSLYCSPPECHAGRKA